MRAFRKRFRSDLRRKSGPRDRAVRTVEGESRYRHSAAGRAVKREHVQAEWQSQHGVCAGCGLPMTLADAVPVKDSWQRGECVPVVHRKCKPKRSPTPKHEEENNGECAQ